LRFNKSISMRARFEGLTQMQMLSLIAQNYRFTAGWGASVITNH
jgi:hypothetical protein